MSVKSRLAKLERAAGVGQMCLGCKRNLILLSDVIHRTRREDLHVRDCDNCGFPSFTILDGYSERERELMRELFFTPEATPPRTLAERQRRYAATLYWHLLPRSREIRDLANREEKRLRSVVPPSLDVRAQLKVLDEWNAQQAAQQAARRLRLSEEEEAEREARRAKGAPTFAVIERVKAEHSKANRGHSSEEIYFFHLLAGLEPLIYGEALPETLAKVEAAEARQREERERQEREELERRERLERERLEREEKYRLEREQRERERLERERARLRAAEPVGTPQTESGAWLRDYQPDDAAPDSPRSRFIKEGVTLPARGSGAVYDPEAAHVPGEAEPNYGERLAAAKASLGLPVDFVFEPTDPTRQMKVSSFYDPNHPDAVQFQRSTPPKLPERRYYRGENYDGDPRY